MKTKLALLALVVSLSGCRLDGDALGLCHVFGTCDDDEGTDNGGGGDDDDDDDDDGDDDLIADAGVGDDGSVEPPPPPPPPPPPSGGGTHLRLANTIQSVAAVDLVIGTSTVASTNSFPGLSSYQNFASGELTLSVVDHDSAEVLATTTTDAEVSEHYTVYLIEAMVAPTDCEGDCDAESGLELRVVADNMDEWTSPNFRFRWANFISDWDHTINVRGALYPSFDYQAITSVEPGEMSEGHAYDATLVADVAGPQLNLGIDLNDDSAQDIGPGTGFGGSTDHHGLDYVFVRDGDGVCLLLIPESGSPGGCLPYDLP